MMYSDTNGRVTAKRWKVPTSTLSRWKRLDVIPDYRAMGKPLDKADIKVEQKLVELIETGWLKARPISRLIGSQDKVNALMTARRHPSDPRYHVNHLSAAEIKKIRKLMDGFAKEVGTLLYLASVTPDGQKYSDMIQTSLRAILSRDYINGVNIRAAMDKQQVARFWSFKRGCRIGRGDLDVIFDKLRLMLKSLCA